MNTRIAMIVALLIGSATVAVANDKFDVNIYRPAIQHSPMDTYARLLARTRPSDMSALTAGFGAKADQICST